MLNALGCCCWAAVVSMLVSLDEDFDEDKLISEVDDIELWISPRASLSCCSRC